MAKATTAKWTCDRCGHEEEAETLPSPWGRFAVADAFRKIGVERECHLCPGCVRIVFECFDAAKGPVDQPGPPAAEKRQRPVFTIEDRSRAVGIAVAALKDTIQTAFDATAKQPTSVISGDIVPGAYEGLAERAAELIGDVIEQLNLKEKTDA